MKIAITGKGGVGKTTVAASLCRGLRNLGRRVTAVDADPDANLAGTLGYRGPEIQPLARLRALVEERVSGTAAGDRGSAESWGGFLRLSPRVDDIPEQVGVVVDGIRLLVMGGIERGRRGCACPENVLLREVLSHLLLDAGEDVVVDMEAGVEHLGRGTAEGVDEMWVLVEPGWASLETAGRVARLAAGLGLRRLLAIANRLAGEADTAFVRQHLEQLAHDLPFPLPLVAVLPLDPGLEAEARSGGYLRERPFHRQLARLASELARRAAVHPLHPTPQRGPQGDP